jgi:hypothetical protein
MPCKLQEWKLPGGSLPLGLCIGRLCRIIKRFKIRRSARSCHFASHENQEVVEKTDSGFIFVAGFEPAGVKIAAIWGGQNKIMFRRT